MSVPSASILDLSPVIPIVVLPDADAAVPLARAVASGGVPVIEITLRSDAALDGVARIRAELPEVTVGVGTLTRPAQVSEALDAGAQFLVSPGATPGLLDAMAASSVPYLPGVATVSEMLEVIDRGNTEMKFFPAEAAGGIAYLKALPGPLPWARFCPTGGITMDSVPAYLAQPNVGCVGGSWVTPDEAVTEHDWPRIEQLAARAAALREHAST